MRFYIFTKTLYMKRDIIREKILSTAESVFERHGYEKTILDDLGRAAGMNKTSLYYYYPNKEEIFAAVIQRQFDAYLLALESKIQKKKDGKNGVRSFMENRHTVLKKFALLYKFRTETNNHQLQEIERREIDFLKQLIAKGIKNGELRKSTEKGAKAILTALNAASSKDVEMLCEFLWEGIGKRKKEKTVEETSTGF